jgi:mannose-6-phosphate isomerase-like protein (cupin superfamily)
VIHAGESIENPVTGERIVFRQTSHETGGEAVVIETYVKPSGFVAAAHVHPSQEERFQVLRGSVGFKVGRRKVVAGPGRRLTVPAGTPHTFWNAGDDVAQFVCEIRPALQFESRLETPLRFVLPSAASAHDSHDGGSLMSFRLRLLLAARVVLVLALAAIGVASDAGRRLRIALVSGSAAGGA